MKQDTQPPSNVFSQYHAHVYFDEKTVEQARKLCESAAKRFGVAMGRVHRKPVGPHPRWSCQLAFPPELFGAFVPWLVQNRGGLTIFLHPNTGQALEDHRDRAVWMGELLPLKLDALTS